MCREDPMNEYGGSYNFKISKKQTVTVWRDIMVLLIGENVEDWIKNTVYGVSVSSRQHVDNYQIWTGSSNKNIQDSIVRSKLEELLYPADIQSFYFKSKFNLNYGMNYCILGTCYTEYNIIFSA